MKKAMFINDIRKFKGINRYIYYISIEYRITVYFNY